MLELIPGAKSKVSSHSTQGRNQVKGRHNQLADPLRDPMWKLLRWPSLITLQRTQQDITHP